ncbi:ATP-binding protein [Actinoplanes sp. NPDC051346]|uniref:ATP-binding protein n=1 Tax=Actinoplanes sp. NPDC051346 TaxID=3155048 RepID=UPI003443B6B0
MSSWPGPGSAEPIEYVFPASPAMLGDIRARVTRLAHSAGIANTELERIVLVANEMAANAIEHSGADALTLRWENTDQGVWITVADEGVFAIGVSDTNHRGLGLKIVLGLADEVTVRAGRPGERGTTIRLYMRVGSRLDASPATTPGQSRLLIIDGDRFAGRSLALFLEAEGYENTLAASVEAGRAELAGRPRLAIVDLLTSNGSTAGLCEEIARAKIPVLALSSLRPPPTLRSDRFLRKPVHPLEVLTAVRQLIEPLVAGAPRNAPHA